MLRELRPPESTPACAVPNQNVLSHRARPAPTHIRHFDSTPVPSQSSPGRRACMYTVALPPIYGSRSLLPSCALGVRCLSTFVSKSSGGREGEILPIETKSLLAASAPLPSGMHELGCTSVPCITLAIAVPSCVKLFCASHVSFAKQSVALAYKEQHAVWDSAANCVRSFSTSGTSR